MGGTGLFLGTRTCKQGGAGKTALSRHLLPRSTTLCKGNEVQPITGILWGQRAPLPCTASAPAGLFQPGLAPHLSVLWCLELPCLYLPEVPQKMQDCWWRERRCSQGSGWGAGKIYQRVLPCPPHSYSPVCRTPCSHKQSFQREAYCGRCSCSVKFPGHSQ